jgi:tripartite-type tricarboxylate transporter receptor subunit TctC
VAEAGVPGFESSAWFAFFGPAGLPRELTGRIATEVGKVMQAKEIQDKLIGFGAVPLWNTPAQFETYFRGEVVRYARLIKAANVVID